MLENQPKGIKDTCENEVRNEMCKSCNRTVGLDLLGEMYSHLIELLNNCVDHLENIKKIEEKLF